MFNKYRWNHSICKLHNHLKMWKINIPQKLVPWNLCESTVSFCYTYGIHFQLVLTKHVPGIKVILTNDKTHEIVFCMQNLWVSFYYCESFESLCVCVWPVLPQVLCNLECHRRFGSVCSLSSPPYTFQSRLSYNDPLHLIICYLISNPWKRDQISI